MEFAERFRWEKEMVQTCYRAAFSSFCRSGQSYDKPVGIQDVDDLAQDTVLRVMSIVDDKAITTEKMDMARKQIRTIASNRFIDILRSKKYRQHEDISEFEVAEKSISLPKAICQRMDWLWARLCPHETRVVQAILHADRQGEERETAADQLGIEYGTLANTLSKIGSTIRQVKERGEASTATIEQYEQTILAQAAKPGSDFCSIDVTGDAASFDNWVTEPHFQGVLHACGEYIQRRRREKPRRSGGTRNFVISEHRLTPLYLANLRQTICQHLRLGISVGLICVTSRRTIPREVAADIACFGEIAVDFGHLEYMRNTDSGSSAVYARQGNLEFENIEKRMAWVRNLDNLTHIIHDLVQMKAVLRDLQERIPSPSIHSYTQWGN